jgi:GWxTD domain-containing protein
MPIHTPGVIARPRTLLRALATAAVLACVHRAAWGDPAGEAEALYQRALAQNSGSVEGRRQAMQCLERATLLAPDRADLQLTLGRLYYRMGFLKQARLRFQRVEVLQPRNADARIGLGQVWRRDYLKYLDRGSLARAIEHFAAAARLEPQRCDAWLELVPLHVEQPNLAAALAAAERARATDSTRADALLALAHAAFRNGQVERADSAFRAALPSLPRLVRERFDDIAPVASEQDTMLLRRLPPSGRPEFVRRFWAEHDPDLATRENEAQLEYWSRVTQAYFLFYNSRRHEWDQRGEVYVRYGPPDKAVYNPVGTRLSFGFGNLRTGASGPQFPMNVLEWTYPQLGMTVVMQDRLLSEYYLRPISLVRDTDPAPDPDSLASHGDALATRGGRGVFPMLPPGARRLPVDGVLARFEGERGPRLLGLVETSGAPGDSLWGALVALDSAAVEVARVGHTLGPSPCDPAALRVGDFATELPPGTYVAGLTVRHPDGRRGIVRATVALAAPATRLALSDVVVSCGSPHVEPGAGGAEPAVRLAANPAGRVNGADPLTVYFEMYHLTPGPDGLVRIEFEYTVRSAERDRRIWIQRMLAPRRALPDISAMRREEQAATLRRQFVSVPVQSLPPGRYVLEIQVRDLVAGTAASRAAEFRKAPS